MAPAALALGGATLAVSFSAIFIRIAQDDPATIVWVRMGIATVLLLPLLARRRRMAAGPRRGTVLVIVSGVLLAGHFLLWTASLAFTSVAASVLLVCAHPALVAPLGRRMLGERLGRATYAGMALTLTGTVITCAGDLHADPRSLLGDLMALGGAVCLAGYLLIGRGVRQSFGVVRYSAMVYATVAVIAAATAAVVGDAHIPPPRTLLTGLALAVVCTIGGHTVYNWALRRVAAITVSLAFLGEPPLTALLAALILATIPPAATIAGGIVIMAGLALAMLDAREPASREPLLALE